MATIVPSAAGAAIGSSVGGGVLGLSSVVIGRAVGATIGQAIDQRILGGGGQAVETGRIDRFRLTGASEGAAVRQVWGRMRVPGQVIWASNFRETATTTGGGKGAPSQPQRTDYSYTVSLALALCEGEIARVGRIWADGAEIAPGDLSMRVYPGDRTQGPDPKMEAVEGQGTVPAYRGIAYVVIEDLELGAYGNRIPQLTFEVVRLDAAKNRPLRDLSPSIGAVALTPGTGEYALATTPVRFLDGPGRSTTVNMNTPSGRTDFATSLAALTDEVPTCGAVSLVVSWFGSDLRCGQCAVRSKVEQTALDGDGMSWRVSGVTRETAETVPWHEGRPIYGGTPTDQSVIEAIRALRNAGQAVMFYPFLLMDQVTGNGLTDPWTGIGEQPELPWRGRITTSLAPGVAGSPDGSATAEAEVAAFFGAAAVGDFAIGDGAVSYTGAGQGFRRMVLHYAHLCTLAGGVEAFCIGSELRSLTQIRGAGGSFPAVEALCALAADVRLILGPDTKIGYAADWSEYFGYHPDDGSGDVLFHLDPLWADPAIDFVGIDNYMPVADWRDGDDHADAAWGSVQNPEYLMANMAGGEGFDWFYANDADRAAQVRTPITDGAYGEPWVWRFKDLASWWSTPHHDRSGGVRSATPTDWVPGSKPIWFTEIGCPAVDKGANAPNLFYDPKSSESALPAFSDGRRDDLMQMQYLRASMAFWRDPVNNPAAPAYAGRMVDTDRIFVWSWDARPHPAFPANDGLWADAPNYRFGHWLNGRVTNRALGPLVEEVAGRAGDVPVETDRLYGLVRGYAVDRIASVRETLQPLMLAYGVEAVEERGTLCFFSRDGRPTVSVDPERLVEADELSAGQAITRLPEVETPGRVWVTHVEADGAYAPRTAEAILPGDRSPMVSQNELPLVLTGAEGRTIVERWLIEAQVARDRLKLALPPSSVEVGAGEVLSLGDGAFWRVDRVETGTEMLVEAVRVEPGVYRTAPEDEAPVSRRASAHVAPGPVFAVYMDLPLLTGDEVPHAPHVAVTAEPWTGPAAIYGTDAAGSWRLNRVVERRATVGVTETPLARAEAGRWDNGPALTVRLLSGELASTEEAAVLGGAAAAVVGDPEGLRWEVIQFAGAKLVSPGVYEITRRLRGQAGTDLVAPEGWPEGSLFVLLDGAIGQLDLPSGLRGVERTWRVGPASRPVADPVHVQTTRAFEGIGLKPYAPVHLRARRAAGDVVLTWVRRTRIDGDRWDGGDVPLGETFERYALRLSTGGEVFRTEEVGAPSFVWSAAMRAEDAAEGPVEVAVAQVSDRFGPGDFRRIVIDG